MITVVNIGTITEGKVAEAIDFLKRFAAMNNKALPGINSAVMRPSNGDANKCLLVNTFESHSQREKFLEDQGNNDEAKALIKEMNESDYFVSDASEQHVYDVVT